MVYFAKWSRENELLAFSTKAERKNFIKQEPQVVPLSIREVYENFTTAEIKEVLFNAVWDYNLNTEK